MNCPACEHSGIMRRVLDVTEIPEEGLKMIIHNICGNCHNSFETTAIYQKKSEMLNYIEVQDYSITDSITDCERNEDDET